MTSTETALRVRSLSKRFGRRLALDGCTFDLPQGKIAALVGPNGAGKSTLLRLAAGLSRPTAGTVEVFGRPAVEQHPDALERVGYLDQARPLYRTWTVGDMLALGESLNGRFARSGAERRLEELGIGLGQRVKRLSLGQQAQVALALCLGKCADLLLLDEPAAALDPLARRQLVTMLLDEVAEREATVLFSSHAVAELEEFCDYVIVLSRSRVQLADDIESVLATHYLLTGPRRDPADAPVGAAIVHRADAGRQSTWLVRSRSPVEDPWWDVAAPSLEEVVLGYLQSGELRTGSGSESNDKLEVAS